MFISTVNVAAMMKGSAMRNRRTQTKYVFSLNEHHGRSSRVSNPSDFGFLDSLTKSQLCTFCSPDRRKESANLCYGDFAPTVGTLSGYTSGRWSKLRRRFPSQSLQPLKRVGVLRIEFQRPTIVCDGVSLVSIGGISLAQAVIGVAASGIEDRNDLQNL